MAEKELIAKAPSGRPTRQPVGFRNRLSTNNTDPDFQYRWVSDIDDRVQSFEAAGYEIVNVGDHKMGHRRVNVGSPVDNTISVGGGTKAVLMRQKKEYYTEDQLAKQTRVSDTEAGIKNPALEGAYGKIDTSVTTNK